MTLPYAKKVRFVRDVAAATLTVLVAFAPGAAQAVPTFDFSTIPGSNNSYVDPIAPHTGSTIFGGITIRAFQGNFSTASALWLRKEGPQDNGLGVCSSGETCPTGGTGGGDINELSNQSALEWIVLQRPLNTIWTEIWVSSLDTGGDPIEDGTLYWSDDLGDLLTGHFSFDGDDFGPDEWGDLLSLTQASAFDPTATYLMFRAGLNGEAVGPTHNNDYLVWGVNLDSRDEIIETPEPSSIALIVTGLLGLAAARRRRKAKYV